MIRAGFLVTAANLTVAVLNFARNILIAHLISVADFGIASTFAVAMSIVEMVSYFALDRLLVQAQDGDDRPLQGTAQAIQAIRGLVSAILLFIVAGPVAALFGVPELIWAYQLLAVIPLLRGLSNIDRYRFQRKMDFRRSSFVDAASALLSTLAAFPLAFWLHDYRAMLGSIIFHQVVATTLSHLVAQRRYYWSWDPQLVRRAFSFGWPLTVNGILLFAAFQGDRIVIGNLMTLETLGWYSVAFTLVFAPASIVSNTLNTLFLPQLSRKTTDDGEFTRSYLTVAETTLVAGVGIAVFFDLFGSIILGVLFGQKYSAAVPILGLLAIMNGIRIARAGPAIAATAAADTRNPMYANIVRALVIPVAYFWAKSGADISMVLLAGIVGESLAFAVSAAVLRKRTGMPFNQLRLPVLVCAAIYCVALAGHYLPQLSGLGWRIGSGAAEVVLLLVLFWCAPHLRRSAARHLPSKFAAVLRS